MSHYRLLPVSTVPQKRLFDTVSPAPMFNMYAASGFRTDDILGDVA